MMKCAASGDRREAFTRLDPSGLGAEVIELRLQRRHSLAGSLELFDSALEGHLEARDSLLQFHRLRYVDLVCARARRRGAVTTDAVQCVVKCKKSVRSCHVQQPQSWPTTFSSALRASAGRCRYRQD